jgi:hypothetical protein
MLLCVGMPACGLMVSTTAAGRHNTMGQLVTCCIIHSIACFNVWWSATFFVLAGVWCPLLRIQFI